jgi:type IV pilus assembly protein PilW
VSGTGPKSLEHGAGIDGDPDNTTGNLSTNFGGDAEVMKLVTRAYYIGWRGDDNNNPPGLFMQEMSKGGMGNAQELVESVDSMQIVYGEDTNADSSADVYRLPAAVTDWSRVVSVRLGLLVRTPEQSGPDVDIKVYDVLSDGSASDNHDPTDDRRQRRIFGTTVQLRNLRTD